MEEIKDSKVEHRAKSDIVADLSKGLKKEFDKEVLQEVKGYIDEYNVLRAEEVETKKAAYIESEGEEAAEYFEAPRDEDDLAFADLIATYGDKKKKYEEHRRAVAQKNVEKKLSIIDELKRLVSEEEHIPTAFNKLNELREQWKGVGEVPNQKYRELEEAFSKGIDDFYYNIKIYKELVEHDLKKNLERKEDLIKRLERIVVIKNIKETERLFKALQQEWYDIGPTFKEDWEEVKERYHHAASNVYEKIKAHFNDIKERNKENLEKKRALVSRMQELAEPLPTDANEWKKRTEKIKALQDEWKKVGPVSRKVSDKVFEEFNAPANRFFEARSEHLKHLKEAQSKVAEKKKVLIARAKELCALPDDLERFDWSQATRKIIQLQKDWKKAGSASRREENKLWTELRQQIDPFFEARKAFEAGAEDREANNAKLKKDIIASVKKWKPADQETENTKAIGEFEAKWRNVGFVPKDQVKSLNEEFRNAIDEKLNSLGLSKEQVEAVKFEEKLKGLSQKDDALSALRKERQFVSKRIDQIKEQIAQYENNLSFFSGSKDNPLLADAHANLAKSKEELVQWEAKMKEVRTALKNVEK